MLFSIVYLILRGMLRLVPSAEGGRDREVEILVLRHQIKVLSRKARRPKLRRLDRVFLSAADTPRSSAGHRSWSHPRRSFTGTASWSRASGSIAASECVSASSKIHRREVLAGINEYLAA